MKINFDRIDVEVSGNFVVANSASFDTFNSLTDIRSLGKIGALNQIPNGPKMSTLNFSYLIDMNDEKVLPTVDEIKNFCGDTFAPVTVSVGGLSGQGYLTDYSLNGSPNSPLQVNATYSIFDETSGSLQGKNVVDSGDFVTRSIAHSWGLIVNTSSGFREEPVLNMSYRFSANWRPIYKVGLQTPFQVQLDSAEERMSFIQETHFNILYSGEDADGVLLDSSLDNIQIRDLSVSCDGAGIDALSDTGNMQIINLDNAKITRNQVNADVNNIATTSFDIRSSY